MFKPSCNCVSPVGFKTLLAAICTKSSVPSKDKDLSAALKFLAQLKKKCGSLDKVKGCIKLTGYVNSVDSFVEQPKIINGASDLISQIFGDGGKHTRAAISVNSLPLGAAVEVDADDVLPLEEDVVELDPLSEVLATLDEADVASDEPEPPDATASISEAVSHLYLIHI